MENTKNQTLSKIDGIPAYKGSSDYFTGEVRVQPIFNSDEDMEVSTAYVTFEKGARTAWHTHPSGQKLIVTEGEGLTKEWNGKVQKFKAGDVIICPAGVKHFHGATMESKMTHIAVTGMKNNEPVKWLEKVTDEEYNSFNFLEGKNL